MRKKKRIIQTQGKRSENANPTNSDQSSTEKEERTKSRDRVFGIVIALIGVAISLLAIFGPTINSRLGSTAISEHYVVPFENITNPSQVRPLDTDVFSRRCVARVFFSCSKGRAMQTTKSILRVESAEPFDVVRLSAYATLEENILYIAVVNNGTLSSDELACKVQIRDSQYTNIDPKEKIGINASTMFRSLDGGDAMILHVADLTGCLEEKEEISVSIDVNGSKRSLDIACSNGKCYIIDHGYGDSYEIKEVFIDVDKDIGKDKLVNHTITIVDNACADTVIYPSKSCKLKFSLTFDVDGNPLEPVDFAASIFVPQYSNIGKLFQYMIDNEVEEYFHNSNTSLEEEIMFDFYRDYDLIDSDFDYV